MRAIRGTDTKPELRVRKLLHALGYRFRLHVASLPGRPDIVFASRKKVIEVRGCFWHRHESDHCSNAVMPKTRQEWWQAKFAANVSRDDRNLAALQQLGWEVLIIWECEIVDEGLTDRLRNFLGKPGQEGL